MYQTFETYGYANNQHRPQNAQHQRRAPPQHQRGGPPNRKRRRTSNLNQIEKRDPNDIEIRFLLHTNHAGGVIGKAGHYINRIREEAGVQIQVQTAIPSMQVRVGSVRGSVENLNRAFELIGEKIQEQERGQEKFGITLLLEQKNCGCVIGQKGCKISATRRDTQAGVKVSNEPIGDSTEKSIEIFGVKTEVFAALAILIEQIATDPKPVATIRRFLDDDSGPPGQGGQPGQNSEYTTTIPVQPAYPSPNNPYASQPPYNPYTSGQSQQSYGHSRSYRPYEQDQPSQSGYITTTPAQKQPQPPPGSSYYGRH